MIGYVLLESIRKCNGIVHLFYRLKGAMMEDVPRIFEAVFACTLEVYREHLLTGQRGPSVASCCVLFTMRHLIDCQTSEDFYKSDLILCLH